MKTSLKMLTAIAFCMGFGALASAQSLAQTMFPNLPAGVPCTTKGNATIHVTFNGTNSDIAAVKKKLDTQTEEIKTLAKAHNFDKFELQSNNYNINSLTNDGNGDAEGSQFRYSGTLSFVMQPADKAADFMAELIKKGFRANLNVNNYRTGNCN